MHNDTILITPREKDVLYLLSNGLTYLEIAIKLAVTKETVKKHLKNIYRKLKSWQQDRSFKQGEGTLYIPRKGDCITLKNTSYLYLIMRSVISPPKFRVL